MSDNLTTQSATLATIPASSVISTEEITTLNAGAVSAQHIQRIAAAIRTADGTAVDLPGSTADGLLVNLGANNDVTVTSGTITLGAGTAAYGKLAANSGVDIGDVDVTSVPADPFGANADAASATGSISAKLRFIASTGIPITGTVTVGSHAVTNAGTFAVQPAGSVAHDSSAAAVNPVLVGGYAAASLPASVTDGDAVRAWYMNGGQAVVTLADSSGNLLKWPVYQDDAVFTPASDYVMMMGLQADESSTDSVNEGDAGCPRMTLDRKVIVTTQVHTAGGETSLSALSTAAVYTVEVKGSAGQVYSLDLFNKGAAAVYVRLYNQTGAPASTDGANIVWRGIVPGSTAGAGFVKSWPDGKAFATGIGIRVSGAIADNDTTVLAANEVTINVGYK